MEWKRKRDVDIGEGWPSDGQQQQQQCGFSSFTSPSSSPFSKRSRGATPQQQLDVESILERVIHWLVVNQGKLPKSLPKLTRAIEKLCTAVVHVSEDVIFYHLLFNGAVEMDMLPSGEKVVKGNANPKPLEEFIGFYVCDEGEGEGEEEEDNGRGKDEVMEDASSHMCPTSDDAPPSSSFPSSSPSRQPLPSPVHLSDDFLVALRRSRSWVAENTGLHTRFVPLPSFLRSLAQICSFKRQVPPSSVTSSLLKRGYIQVSHNLSIHYNMEDLVDANSRCKYVCTELTPVTPPTEREEDGMAIV